MFCLRRWQQSLKPLSVLYDVRTKPEIFISAVMLLLRLSCKRTQNKNTRQQTDLMKVDLQHLAVNSRTHDGSKDVLQKNATELPKPCMYVYKYIYMVL